MKIAFYAPLKSPHHAVPSGDRLMARLLIAALRMAGHAVDVASELRCFIREPSSAALATCEVQAGQEIDRLSSLWRGEGAPDLWFCYHPYYKAPDLLGPGLARSFGMAYVTAETSYSGRRNLGSWSRSQACVVEAIEQAAVNICLTARDCDGLLEAAPAAAVAMLAPFLDSAAFLTAEPQPLPDRLITVAMMRSGDKMDSYRMLAGALQQLGDRPWTLSIVGDGPCRAEVGALFAGFPAARILWHGEQSPPAIAALLSQSAVYVWPGCGEAYGLAYLEAQAAGLPVVAQEIAGVPEVVVHGRTGILTPPGDTVAFAAAIAALLDNSDARLRLAQQARQFARQERSLEAGSAALAAILEQHIGTRS